VFLRVQAQQAFCGEFVECSEFSPGLGIYPPHPDTAGRTGEGTKDSALLLGSPELHDVFDHLIVRKSQQHDRRFGDTPYQPLPFQRYDDGGRDTSILH
jgi:hypothetical protein